MKKKTKKPEKPTVPAQPFSEVYEAKKLKKEIGVTGLFLCLICIVMAAFFFIRSLAAVGAQETVLQLAAAVFLGILFIYVFFPVQLFRFLKKLRPVTDTVGKYVLRVILIPVYLLLCAFSLPFAGKHKKNYRFAMWETDAPPEDSYFAEDSQNAFQKSSAGTFRFITSLLGTTAEKRQFFLFPVLLLLLLLGLFFYFISTTTILGFVYTLF